MVRGESDAEMKEMAHEELRTLESRRDALDAEITLLLIPKDPNDEKNVLLEIRAGTGGEEAALFAAEVFRMYTRFAERERWKVDVVSMTRAMALELAPYNIRVNAIAPGTTDTAQPRYGNTDAELVEMARTSIPLGGKLLTPDQIAQTAVFLASDEASAVTGQVLHVNGGSYMP